MTGDQPQPAQPGEQPMRRQPPHAPRCHAKTRAGTACQGPRVRGRARCRMHGGASLVGPASPSWRTGKYSKVLPTRLRAAHIAALNDPGLLQCRDDIAVLDARLAELVGRLDGGAPSDSAWTSLGAALDARSVANDRGDASGWAAADAQIAGLIVAGEADAAVWRQISGTMMRRDRLTRSMMRQQVALETLVPVGTLTAFVQAFVELVANICCYNCTIRLRDGANALLIHSLAEQPAAPDARPDAHPDGA